MLKKSTRFLQWEKIKSTPCVKKRVKDNNKCDEKVRSENPKESLIQKEKEDSELWLNHYISYTHSINLDDSDGNMHI